MGLWGRTTKLLTYLVCFNKTQLLYDISTKYPKPNVTSWKVSDWAEGAEYCVPSKDHLLLSAFGKWEQNEWLMTIYFHFLMSFTKEMLWTDLDNMTALWMRPENCLQKFFKLKRKQKACKYFESSIFVWKIFCVWGLGFVITKSYIASGGNATCSMRHRFTFSGAASVCKPFQIENFPSFTSVNPLPVSTCWAWCCSRPSHWHQNFFLIEASGWQVFLTTSKAFLLTCDRGSAAVFF